ncbi:hypothetical protein AYO41_00040 [Verrucomicrobia bacterium SCGC AG-212-E04]|nr:hypothetical protein AYO41_00040 [Verrucomicrobia bacterium SCGC AG-212-E04]
MKLKSPFIAMLVSACLGASALFAGTPEQEKAFLEKYKKALESNDTTTLQSFLYTQGANPMALQFYTMMQADGAGGTVSNIELVDLTPDDVKKAAATMDGPGGLKMKMPLKPVKKLKITVAKKTGDSTSSSSSENFVAEKDGKFVIPVPVNAK